MSTYININTIFIILSLFFSSFIECIILYTLWDKNKTSERKLILNFIFYFFIGSAILMFIFYKFYKFFQYITINKFIYLVFLIIGIMACIFIIQLVILGFLCIDKITKKINTLIIVFLTTLYLSLPVLIDYIACNKYNNNIQKVLLFKRIALKICIIPQIKSEIEKPLFVETNQD